MYTEPGTELEVNWANDGGEDEGVVKQEWEEMRQKKVSMFCETLTLTGVTVVHTHLHL